MNLFFLSLAALGAAQSVTLPGGILQGGHCSSSNASYFYSVPYGQPPVGDLRFAPPQPYNGTLGQATKPAPPCIQFGTQFIEAGTASEDCLYLDVWTPPNASNLPVKVWIYGGGNTAGSISNPTYQGCNLATDSVVVSINYRLGPLGFLGLSSVGIGGNMGIQDILLGLQWVQTNIKAFGGDPRKVLLFGQSAGASDTFVIGTLPQAPSLINAGIAESGGGRQYPANGPIQAQGASYVKNLNCSDIACLRSKSTAELNATLPASNGLRVTGLNNLISFGPFVDGKIVAAQPSEVGVQVPFIFGSTSMEGTLFTLAVWPNPASATAANYTAFLQRSFNSSAALVESTYPLSAFNNTPFPAFYAITTVYTQYNFLCPAYRGLNQAVQKGKPVWTYLWNHGPTCPWYGNIPAAAVPLLGATHTAEIPFVFNNVNNLPLPNGTCNLTSAEQALASQFVGAWSSMAANGNPGTQWPAYQTNSSMGLNVANTSVAGMVDYSSCQFWDSIAASIANNISAAGNASTSTGGTNGTSTGPAVQTSTGDGAVLSVQSFFAIATTFVVGLFCYL